MLSLKCIKCGKVNNDVDLLCVGCGEDLRHSRELRDLEEYRKRYGLFGIFMAILVLLLFWLLLQWLIRDILPAAWKEPIPPVILKYVAPFLIILVFLLSVLPMIIRRWTIWRRYRWTMERIRELRLELDALPMNFFGMNTPGGGNTQTPVRNTGCSSIVPLFILFLIIGLFVTNQFTDWKPLDAMKSIFNTIISPANNIDPATSIGPVTAQIVNGRYECHMQEADLGGGVARSEQTWAYVFYANYSYTTYLNGYQQFSGAWSQTGNVLTINTPAIPGLSAEYTSQAAVALNGQSFTANGNTFVKVY